MEVSLKEIEKYLPKYEKLKVNLLHFTPLWICEMAGKVCVGSIIQSYTPNLEYIKRFVKNNEESVIEHIVFTFYIENITRGLLQELARHRIASYSVKSTRWTLKRLLKDLESLIRSTCSKKEPNLDDFCNLASRYFRIEPEAKFQHYVQISTLVSAYKQLKDISKVKYFIPDNLYTNVVMTINARSLRNLFKLRLDKKAWIEFRILAYKLLKAIPSSYRKCLFFDFGGLNEEEKEESNN